MACVSLKWPPLPHISARLVGDIADSFEAGTYSSVDLAEFFTCLYDQEQLGRVRADWSGYGCLGPRLPILAEAINNHLHGITTDYGTSSHSLEFIPISLLALAVVAVICSRVPALFREIRGGGLVRMSVPELRKLLLRLLWAFVLGGC